MTALQEVLEQAERGARERGAAVVSGADVLLALHDGADDALLAVFAEHRCVGLDVEDQASRQVAVRNMLHLYRA